MGQTMKKETADTLQTVSPVDGSVYVDRPFTPWAKADAALTLVRVERSRVYRIERSYSTRRA